MNWLQILLLSSAALIIMYPRFRDLFNTKKLIRDGYSDLENILVLKKIDEEVFWTACKTLNIKPKVKFVGNRTFIFYRDAKIAIEFIASVDQSGIQSRKNDLIFAATPAVLAVAMEIKKPETSATSASQPSPTSANLPHKLTSQPIKSFEKNIGSPSSKKEHQSDENLTKNIARIDFKRWIKEDYMPQYTDNNLYVFKDSYINLFLDLRNTSDEEISDIIEYCESENRQLFKLKLSESIMNVLMRISNRFTKDIAQTTAESMVNETAVHGSYITIYRHVMLDRNIRKIRADLYRKLN